MPPKPERKFTKKMSGILLALLIVITAMAFAYLLIGVLTYIICFAFGLAWNLLIPLGVLAIIWLLSYAVKCIFSK